MRQWILVLVTLIAFTAKAAGTFVDTDGDGVPDWEDYCPNTPRGEVVWTLKTVQEAHGDPTWVGCAEGERPPNKSFVPPSRESVLEQAAVAQRKTEEEKIAVERWREEEKRKLEEERKAAILKGQRDLIGNLAKSYEAIAKESTKSRALVYRKAVELLKMKQPSLSLDSAMDTLCASKLVVDVTMPILEGQSAKVLEKAVVKAKEFSGLLNSSVGSRCETTSWSIEAELNLILAGWNGLGLVGFRQEDLGRVSQIKAKLGVAIASLSNRSFSNALQDFVSAQDAGKRIVESFHENDLVLGVALMMESINERLKQFLHEGGQIQTGLVAGEISFSSALISAAHFPISGAGCDPGFSTHFCFVPIEAGSFMMGSPTSELGRYNDEVEHKVILTDGFEMQTTGVTQNVWEKVMGSNPSYFRGPELPVETVSWNDTREFIHRLNEMRKGEGYEYRLPTEAEWEYAARAGTKTAYFFGNDSGPLPQYAWYDENSAKQTHPVATKLANPWGLYDMHGNLWQWVEDYYQENLGTSSVTNPLIISGSNRVIRGGSWGGFAQFLRSANRFGFSPDLRVNDVGFRLVRTVR